MSIATYSELQTAIASWMDRTDLTARLPEFIALVEARLNRTFVPRSVEQEDELVTVPGSRYVALPSGVVNPIGLWLKAWLPRQKLMLCLPEELPVKQNASGYPEYWAIDGSNIAFDKLALDAYTFDFRYVKEFALSEANPTNYVLTHNPDVYLWGSLLEASTYLRDADGIALYEPRFQQALKDAQANENDTRANAPMTTELVGMGRRGWFNILRGY